MIEQAESEAQMAYTALEKTRRTNADRYGCGVGEKAWRKMLREQMRCHKQALDGELTKARILRHVDELSHDEKNKDWMPFNSMLKLVKKFDGLRIYQYSGRADQQDIAY
jgi:hypothetical protein